VKLERERAGEGAIGLTDTDDDRSVPFMQPKPDGHRHLVQFYSSDAYLVDVVGSFLADGLGRGEGVLLIATRDHRARIEDLLASRGASVATAAEGGRYAALDAADTVASFMSGGIPDAEGFRGTLSSEVVRLCGLGRRVRVVSEMVGFLGPGGNSDGAIQLEQLWNSLLARWPVTLLCAYPTSALGNDPTALIRICSAHSRVLAEETIPSLPPPADQLLALIGPSPAGAVERDTALLAAIVDSSDDAIISKDLDGNITSWNRGAERLFGYAEREILGQPITLLMPPERLHEEPRIVERIHTGERIEHYETVRRRKDASLVEISLTVSPVRDSLGRVVGASKIARNISERKQAEHLLQQAEERYGRLVSMLPVGVYACDAAGALTYFSEHACRLWGRTPRIGDDEGSITLLDSEHRTPLGRGESPMAVALRARRSCRNVEVVVARPDGSQHTVLMNIDVLYGPNGEVSAGIGVFHDVTDLKNKEVALREADRRKDEFLAVLAHELRNPLAPIMTGLEILELAASDAETVENTRRTMEGQARQLMSLVDDLLDVSRITTGKFQLRKRAIDLAAVIQSAVDASRPAMEEGGHALTVDVPSAPVWLEADPHRLAQVFFNLLDNAAKYTPSGGRVEVTTSVLADQVSVSIADSGVGIPTDKLDSIFEKFAQIDRPQEHGQSGLGIGLTLARTVVEMHGGSLTARSSSRRGGATFIVTLPSVGRLRAEDSPLVEPARHASRPRRVLLVDDNEAMLESLSIVVGLLGHDVRTAPDGESALRVAEEFRPDFVLMDLGMPRMTGYEAARRMREEPWGAALRLIALTGWGQDEHLERTRNAGFDKHVVKPIRQADLERLFAEA
jgi:PAS domain S-box-containing protein